MLRNTIFTLSTLALLAGATSAQNCGYNQFPITLVNAQGIPLPVANEGQYGVPTARSSTEAVYLAFDSTLPSGTYYVHVTDAPDGINDEVLSTNDPMDRFVTVTNTGSVITLSLPFANNPNPSVFGLGLGGIGQSILLSPVRNSVQAPCSFKAWFGDTWDLSSGPTNPYLIRGGQLNPSTNQCTIASYHYFRIGDGTGTDVSGNAFLDSDRDGVRDGGEGPLANWGVRLVTGAATVTTTTDAAGHYAFPNVTAATYTVELTVRAGYSLTTAGQFIIEVCGCADVAVGDFGAAPQMLACEGHTIGFWRNVHGRQLVQSLNILADLPGLYLRDPNGNQVAPSTLVSFRAYLQGANSVNMAYMLSAQLVAMHCNVRAGFVDPNCVIQDSNLGNITIGALMQSSILSLMAHGYTPAGSPWRAEQQRLKNALDNANNNRNWL